MSQLYQVHGMFLKQFTQLAQIAGNQGVKINVSVYPDGTIKLQSNEVFTKNNKKCLRQHQIIQGKQHVSESTDTFVIEE